MADPSQVNSAVAAYATSLSGKIPYHLGASVRNTANMIVADCSSFVQMVYAKVGLNLPRTADKQYKATKDPSAISEGTIDKNNLRPGDLLFFGGWNTPDNPPGYAGIQHVGIYIGNGQFVNEGSGSTNGQNVGVDSLTSYQGHFIAATRPIAKPKTDEGGNLLTDNPVAKFFGGVGDGIGGLGNLVSNPGKTAGDAIGTATEPVAKAIADVGGTIQDVFVWLGIIGLAFVLIIGGLLLVRPQTISDVASAAGKA